MSKKRNDVFTTMIFSLTILLISAVCFLKPDSEYSFSERRVLAKFPDLSSKTIKSGNFMREYETYVSDQFPFRESFRSLKAYIATDVFKLKENNGLYFADGHISKLEEKENPEMTDHATLKFKKIYETFLKTNNTKVYFTIIPDKNFYLAEKNGYPSLNYNLFIKKFKDRTKYMEYIDISNLLSINDYYTTDSHWKQERLMTTAKNILYKMGRSHISKYSQKEVNVPFYGVYAGQWAKKISPDRLMYLTNNAIENCSVVYYDNNGKPHKGSMYNMEKALGKDPYEMFLSGTNALIEIENHDIKSDDRLVVFRDSFFSSIAPLLCENYRKITLIDIRYISSDVLDYFVDFKDCDVLFAYSVSVLNNSLALR